MVPSGGLDEHSAEAKRPPSIFSSIGTTEIAVFPSQAKKATSIIFSSHPAVFPLYPDTRKHETLANALTKGEFLCVEDISLGAFCSGDDGRRSGEERKGRGQHLDDAVRDLRLHQRSQQLRTWGRNSQDWGNRSF